MGKPAHVALFVADSNDFQCNGGSVENRAAGLVIDGDRPGVRIVGRIELSQTLPNIANTPIRVGHAKTHSRVVAALLGELMLVNSLRGLEPDMRDGLEIVLLRANSRRRELNIHLVRVE
jgi:hypothetical protein